MFCILQLFSCWPPYNFCSRMKFFLVSLFKTGTVPLHWLCMIVYVCVFNIKKAFVVGFTLLLLFTFYTNISAKWIKTLTKYGFLKQVRHVKVKIKNEILTCRHGTYICVKLWSFLDDQYLRRDSLDEGCRQNHSFVFDVSNAFAADCAFADM